jgi:hypothetical protein
MFSHAFSVSTVDSGTKTGNYRFFGLGIAAGSPTVSAPITNGVGFEWRDTDGLLYGVVWSNGSRTQSVALSASQPSDGAAHRYAVYYKTSRVYFEIDNVNVGTIATPNPNTSNLPMLVISVNGASTVSPAAVFTHSFLGVGDTAGNGRMLSDASFPWRKATISAAGALSVRDAGLPAALGAATTANSTAVNIASDQTVSALLPDLNVTGQSAQTATVNNIIPATSGASATDATGYRSGTIQVVSTGTAGTFIFEGSNDNTNFQAVPVYSQLILTGTPITAAITATASQLIYTFPVTFRYLRLRIATTITGGSIQAFTRLSQAAWTPAIFQVAQATAGNLNMTATLASTTLSGGQTAHSAASTGNPLRVAGRVITTLDTTLVQGDASDIAVTTGQQLVTKDFASSENDWQFVGTVTTNTQTAIKAAGAASIRNFVTGLTYQNTNATATTLNIQDGNTNILSISCAASMANPVNLVFPTPLRGTAATAVNYTAGTTGANVLLNVQGYQSF